MVCGCKRRASAANTANTLVTNCRKYKYSLANIPVPSETFATESSGPAQGMERSS